VEINVLFAIAITRIKAIQKDVVFPQRLFFSLRRNIRRLKPAATKVTSGPSTQVRE
jgi:hypothetical protein